MSRGWLPPLGGQLDTCAAGPVYLAMSLIGTDSPGVLRDRTAVWLFLATWTAAALYGFARLNVGWFPADAGALGEAAERVLHGQLPHRDFAAIYTGGLAMLDALAFKVLGVSVMSMRWVTYAVYLVWVPAFFAIAARVAGVGPAVPATLLAASWTLPVYAEGMPSWYNLFLATFGALALVRFLDTRRGRWLFLAGLAGGLSVLVKVTGLYYLAAVVLVLVHYEATSDEIGHGGADAASGDDAYRLLVGGGCLTFAGVVSWLVIRGMGARHLFLYATPAVCAVVPLLLELRRSSGRSTASRLRTLVRLGLPVVLGALVPVVIFLVPFMTSGAVGALVEGVFVRPGRRLSVVRLIGPAGHWFFAAPAVVMALWVMWAPGRRRSLERIGAVAGVATLAVMVVASGDDLIYLVSFRALVWLAPLVCLSAAWAYARRANRGGHRPLLVLALSVYGLINLIQVPFAAPVYFFYAAPLGILVVLGVVGREPSRRRHWVVLMLVAVLGLTVLRFNEGFSVNLGFRSRPHENSTRLTLQRAMGLRVSPSDRADYEGVVNLVDSIGGGDALYAGPDAPEIYFLTGLTNPTPTLFEVLDDPGDHDARVLRAVDGADVRAVVIRPTPLFSRPVSGRLARDLEQRFPMGRQIGRFIVAWRGGAGSAK